MTTWHRGCRDDTKSSLPAGVSSSRSKIACLYCDEKLGLIHYFEIDKMCRRSTMSALSYYFEIDNSRCINLILALMHSLQIDNLWRSNATSGLIESHVFCREDIHIILRMHIEIGGLTFFADALWLIAFHVGSIAGPPWSKKFCDLLIPLVFFFLQCWSNVNILE